MKIVYISGSPRKHSNTDELLNEMLNRTGGERVKLADYRIEPCRSCWACIKTGRCGIKDDMKTTLIQQILAADALVLGTPVYFNNVSAQLKAFIDRTWSIRGKLRNKIGAAVVAGRRDGAETALAAIHAFFLKHEMIIAGRGISGVAFQPGTIRKDRQSFTEAARLADRVLELGAALYCPEWRKPKG
ncbi:flavodoxin family protein [bacterium]|nr:flavodoxin family protein [bacterium]